MFYSFKKTDIFFILLQIWKTLETAEKTLLEMLSTKDFDCATLFEEDSANRNGVKQPETLALKRRADKQETEDFYLNVRYWCIPLCFSDTQFL